MAAVQQNCWQGPQIVERLTSAAQHFVTSATSSKPITFLLWLAAHSPDTGNCAVKNVDSKSSQLPCSPPVAAVEDNSHLPCNMYGSSRDYPPKWEKEQTNLEKRNEVPNPRTPLAVFDLSRTLNSCEVVELGTILNVPISPMEPTPQHTSNTTEST
eukprot:4450437-Amphidinium_carterae.3